MNEWRMLQSGLSDGATNMAMDEAMTEALAAGRIRPTLRFYGWRPYAVSLGYFQKADREMDLAACRAQGIDIVRRLTGGRAVLHSTELTYSIVVPEDYEDMPRTITASYSRLTKGLLLGLRELGVDAQMAIPVQAYGNEHGRRKTSAACFDAPSHYELTVDRRKLVGSAQVRRQGVILQHGSILLDFDALQMASILKDKNPDILEILQCKVTSLKQLKIDTALPELMNVLARGFEQALNISLVPGEPVQYERELLPSLITKYANETWTLKR